MQRAISTYLFRHAPLGGRVLDQIAKAGFGQVELYCSRPHFDYTNPDQKREIANWFLGSSVKLLSVHAPLSREPVETSHHGVVSIAYLEHHRREDSMDEIKRALELAELVPFRYLILHLGVVGEEYDQRKFDAALTCLEHLRLFAGQRGVQILLENIPNDLSRPPRLLEFFHHTHLHDLKVCFDTGHALLDGNVLEAMNLLRDYLAAAHVHDNDGDIDEHGFPFEGKIPWEETIQAFRRLHPSAPLVLEVRDGEPVVPNLEKAAQVFDQFQRIWEEADGPEDGPAR